MLAHPLITLAALLGAWFRRHECAVIAYLRTENRVLRSKLPEQRLSFTAAERRRLARVGRLLGRAGLRSYASVAHPDTILRWYRELIARKYTAPRRTPSLGRPRRIVEEIRALVSRMALENPRWGYTRILGALRELGHVISRSTVRRVLVEQGIDPAPNRGRDGVSWRTFIAAHLRGIAAADFFTVEVLRPWGLVRYLVLFVIDVASRRVHVAGIAHNPGDEWMKQMARNLTDVESGFLRDKQYLIADRDPLFSSGFRAILESSGVEVLRLPARSPNLNAYAERFVLSIRSECLRHIIPLSEGHLWHVISEYLEHYHHERNHQGIGNVIIQPRGPPRAVGEGDPGASIRRRKRLGGILSYYYRKAA